MSTNTPVILGRSWQSVQVGQWSGSIQNVGNAPLVGIVVVTAGGVPAEGEGGFAIYSTAVSISIASNETLYVRACADVGAVVLG
jgi:hypothetical protein